jgi:hypothetical protein
MKLPNGTWIFFGNVTHEATAEDLQSFLAEVGIEIGLDRISMVNHQHDQRASAVISLPPSEIAVLVERAINQRPLMGRVLRVSSPGARG